MVIRCILSGHLLRRSTLLISRSNGVLLTAHRSIFGARFLTGLKIFDRISDASNRSPLVPLKPLTMQIPLRFKHLGSHDHNHQSKTVPDKDVGAGSRITIIGIGLNSVLAAAKAAGGVIFHSTSLVADSVHSFSDLISDFVTLATLKIARKPKDERYPYGYGRYETFGALGVSGLLLMAGIGIGFHSTETLLAVAGASLDVYTGALSQPHLHVHPPPVGPEALLIVLASILTKEWLFRKTVNIGYKLKSQVLVANAWHHRSDALSSVVALVGIGGSIIGVPVADPISGIVVSGMIVKSAGEVGWRCVKELLDSNVGDAAERVRAVTSPLQNSYGEIRDIHDIRARRMGPNLLVDLHIQVDPFLSVSSAHEAAQRVRALIMQKIPEINEILVHVDVDEHTDPSNSESFSKPLPEIEKDVRNAVKNIPEILGVSHVGAHFLHKRTLVEVQIIVDENKTVKEAQKVALEAKNKIEAIPSIHEAHVDLEMTESHSWNTLEPVQKLMD